MAIYKIIKTINAGSGSLKDKNGNMVSVQELAPKVGDIISGNIKTKFIFNQNLIGLDYSINTGAGEQISNSLVSSGSTIIFIPEDSLEFVSDEMPIPQLNVFSNNPPKRSIFSLKNIIISIIATGSLFYFLRKKKIL